MYFTFSNSHSKIGGGVGIERGEIQWRGHKLFVCTWDTTNTNSLQGNKYIVSSNATQGAILVYYLQSNVHGNNCWKPIMMLPISIIWM